MSYLKKTPILKSLRRFVVILSLITPVIASDASAQGLSFLLISPGPDANGWGGISTAATSNNAISITTSPGQLGIFSLRNYFSASSYTDKTAWLPSFQQPDLTYNAWALVAGYNLQNILQLPLPVSIGLGYSRIDLDLGTFIRTGSGGPEPIGTFDAYEQSTGITIGAGVDYLLRLGLGWTFKDVHSVLGPTEMDSLQGDARASMTDFGLMLQAPVIDIIEAAMADSIRVFGGIKPQFLLTFGYTLSNRGDETVSYLSSTLDDPLPRNAITGLSMEFAFTKRLRHYEWQILAFTLAREAEDLLVSLNPDGSFEYQSGWGDVSFFKNVIAGEINGSVNLHKGWQLNACELLYLRGGSYAEAKEYGNRNYSTSGYALRMSGLFRLLELLAPDTMEDQWLSFISDHIDIIYDHAEYSDHPILGGTSFNALNLIMR